MSKELLKARVKAVNLAHKTAMEVYDLLSPLFASLVGEKIIKQDGQFMAKHQKNLPTLPSETRHVTIFRNVTSDYSLSWTVKVCEHVDGTHTCTYEEHTVYIGNLTCGTTLKDVDYERPNLRTDYTVEEITHLREVYEEKKREADKARNDLYPFGDSDH